MSAIKPTRGSGPIDGYFSSPVEPTAPPRPTARAVIADIGSEFQPAIRGASLLGSSRPVLLEPTTGATAEHLAAAAEKIAFPQTVFDFAAIQQRLARRPTAADAPSVMAEFYVRLDAADAVHAIDALFSWLSGLERVAAAPGPLLPAVLISASVRALQGLDVDSVRIEKNFTALFRAFGMSLADARYSAYLTASTTTAAANVALTAVSAASAASGLSPTDDSLTAMIAALASARNPATASPIASLTPETRELLADLRHLLDRQASNMAAAIDELHGAADNALHSQKN